MRYSNFFCLTDLLCREENGSWVEEQKLDAHHDWVRDVAWAPSVGLQRSIIASCSQVTPAALCTLQVRGKYVIREFISGLERSAFVGQSGDLTAVVSPGCQDDAVPDSIY